MTRRPKHPFAHKWNHNTHYFPLLAARIPTSSRQILDIGCGDGTFCEFIADGERVVVGVDTDTSILPPSRSGMQFAVTSADALGFRDHAFDAVTVSMALHHVDAESGLAEAVRVLAPGGTLLVLGYGRFGGVRDVPHELGDLLTHRVVSRRMQPWEPSTLKAEPSGTWSEVRTMARRLLPGSNYRRLAMWRYLIEWHKPSTLWQPGGPSAS